MKTRFAATAVVLASALIGGTSFAGVGHAQVQPVRAQAVSSSNIVSGAQGNALYPNRDSANQVQASMTREQVKAELAEAIRTGDIVANGERGLKLNELSPSRYPARAVQASLTREQVKAELAVALRTGDFFLNGENDSKCNEVHPSMHAAL